MFSPSGPHHPGAQAHVLNVQVPCPLQPIPLHFSPHPRVGDQLCQSPGRARAKFAVLRMLRDKSELRAFGVAAHFSMVSMEAGMPRGAMLMPCSFAICNSSATKPVTCGAAWDVNYVISTASSSDADVMSCPGATISVCGRKGRKRTTMG